MYLNYYILSHLIVTKFYKVGNIPIEEIWEVGTVNINWIVQSYVW